MTHRTKRLKALKTVPPESGDASSRERVSMNPDPVAVVPDADPALGTAPISAVTDAAMDRVAHRGAVLADGVAHRTVSREGDLTSTADDEVGPVTGMTLDLSDDAAATEASAGMVDEARIGYEPVFERSSDAGADVAPAVRDRIETASSNAEAALSEPTDAFGHYQAKIVDMMRSHIEATGAHVAALLQAKTFPEAVVLNADHLRRQRDAMTAQGRELATLAQTLTLAALKPPKGVVAPDR